MQRLSIFDHIKDLSLWALILGNLLSMYLAYIHQWPLFEVMWIYWVQSLIIGAFNALRMLKLKEFVSIEKDGNVKEGTPAIKIGLTAFFIFHYSFFHFVYAQFLSQKQPLEIIIESGSFMLFLICVIGFLCSHSYSFFYNFKTDFKDSKPDINQIMMYPYKRIIPMHFTILFGGLVSDGISYLLVFMALKTYADVHMHILEHKLFRKSDPLQKIKTKEN